VTDHGETGGHPRNRFDVNLKSLILPDGGVATGVVRVKWEWAIGEIILLLFCFYELWSLRRYNRANRRTDRGDRPFDSVD
jgi:hypothetical protein